MHNVVFFFFLQWINNLEVDSRYNSWPSSLQELLRPTFPGVIRQIRKNLHNMVSKTPYCWAVIFLPCLLPCFLSYLERPLLSFTSCFSPPPQIRSFSSSMFKVEGLGSVLIVCRAVQCQCVRKRSSSLISRFRLCCFKTVVLFYSEDEYITTVFLEYLNP